MADDEPQNPKEPTRATPKNTEAAAERQATIDVKRRKRRVASRVAFGFVTIFAGLFGCGKLIANDDDDTPPVVTNSSESAAQDTTEDAAPSGGTVPPSVPEALRVATPVAAAVTSSNTMVVDFQGKARELVEGGTLSTFQLTTSATSETIQVTLNYILDSGEPRHGASRTDTADAVPTADGQGTVTRGISGRVEGTWTADDSLTLMVDGFEIPEGASVEVQVFIQETPASEFHALVLP